MSSVDNRIVNMRFDNAQFEKGVAQTTKTIASFNDDLGKLANKSVDFGGMAKGVDQVAGRFTWFGDLAFQAMQRVNAGILDAVSTLNQYRSMLMSPFSGATDGFNEYELKMGAVQTIVAGVSKDFGSQEEALEAVNEKLEELNAYSDRTIYSFRDMTQNIGKFTNAGIDLDQSVAAIQGIANAAALSGANANEASRAMYNFSQALSKGYVQLIDWKSIENANMATEEFKNQLIESAVACGQLVKGSGGLEGLYYQVDATGKQIGVAFNATKNFNDSLKDGWMTSEALIDTLGDYADATTEIGARATAAATEVKTFSMLMDTLKEALGSGWAQSFEIVIGDFSEAKALWTEVNDVLGGYVGRNADARNEMLKTWKVMGGRKVLLQGFADGFWSIVEVVKAIKDGFRDIFPPTTVASLLKATKAFGNFMSALKPSEYTLDRISRIFRGLASVLDLLLMPIRALISGIKSLFAPIEGVAESAESLVDIFLEMVADIADFIFIIRQAIKECSSFADAFELIKKAGSRIWEELVKNAEIAFDMLSGVVIGTLEKIGKFIEDHMPSLDISGMFNFNLDDVKAIGPKLKEYARILKEFIESSFSKLLDFGKNNPIIDGLVNGLLSGIKKVKEAIVFVGQWIKKAFCDLLGIHSPSTVFYEYGRNIWQGFILGLQSLAKNVYAAIKWIGKEMLKAFGWMVDLVKGVLAGMGTSIRNVFDDAAAAVNDFTYKLANTDFSVLDYIQNKFNEFNIEGSTFGNIVKIFQNIINFFKPVWFWAQDTFGPLINFIWSKLQLITPANIAALLAGRGVHLTGLGIFKFMSDLNKTIVPLTEGLGKMFTQFGGVAESFGKLMGNIGDTFKAFQLKIKAEALRSIAISFVLLAGAFGLFGMLPWETIAGSITGMLAAAGALSGVLFTLSKVNLGGGVNLVSIAGGLLMISWALENLADENLWGLIKAVGAIYFTLASIETFITMIDTVKLLAVSLSLGKMALAIYGLAWSVEALGENKLWDLAKGVTALISTLGGIGYVLNKFPFKMSAKLVPFAAAMVILSYAIGRFAGVDWKVMVAGLANLGSTMMIVGYALKAYPVGFKGISGMISLAAALTMLIIPIKVFAAMHWQKVLQGIGGLFLELVTLGGVVWGLSKIQGDINKIAFGLVMLAGAAAAMVIPITIFGSLPWDQLLWGVGTLAVVVGGLTYALNKMPNNENLMKLGIAIGALAGACTLLAIAVSVIGRTNWWILTKGMIVFGATIYGLAKALTKMGPLDFKKMAWGLAAVAGTIALLMGAVYLVGTANAWDSFQGLIVLGVALAILYGAIKALNGISIDKSALYLLGLAGALALLTVPLLLLADLSWEQIFRGLTGLGLAAIEAAGAFWLVGKIVGTMNAVTIGKIVLAMVGAGVGIAAIGAGIWIVAGALKALSEAYAFWYGSPDKDYIDTVDIQDKLIDRQQKEIESLKGQLEAIKNGAAPTDTSIVREVEKSTDTIVHEMDQSSTELAAKAKDVGENTADSYFDGMKAVLSGDTSELTDMFTGMGVAMDDESQQMLAQVQKFASAMDKDGKLNTDALPDDLKAMFTKSNGVINKDGREMRDLFAALPEDMQKSLGGMNAGLNTDLKSIGNGYKSFGKNVDGVYQGIRESNSETLKSFNHFKMMMTVTESDKSSGVWVAQNNAQLEKEFAGQNKIITKEGYTITKLWNGMLEVNTNASEEMFMYFNSIPSRFKKSFNKITGEVKISGEDLSGKVFDVTTRLNKLGEVNLENLSENVRNSLKSQTASVAKEAKDLRKSLENGLDPEYSRKQALRFMGATVQIIEDSSNDVVTTLGTVGERGSVAFAENMHGPNGVEQWANRVVFVTKQEGDKIVQRFASIGEDGTLTFIRHAEDFGEKGSEIVKESIKEVESAVETQSKESGDKVDAAFKKNFLDKLSEADMNKIIGEELYMDDAENKIKAVGNVFDKLATEMGKGIEEIPVEELKQKLEARQDELLSPIQKMKNAIPDAMFGTDREGSFMKNATEKLLGGSLEKVTEALPDELKPIAQDLITEFSGTLKEGAPKVAESIKEVIKVGVTDVLSTDITIDTTKPSGRIITGGLAASIKDGTPDVQNAIKEMLGISLKEVDQNVGEILSQDLGVDITKPVGKVVTAGLDAGITEGTLDLKAATTAMIDAGIKDVLSSDITIDTTKPAGKIVTAGLGASIIEGTPDVVAGIKGAINTAIQEVSSNDIVINTDNSAGRIVTAALANTINEGSFDVKQAAVQTIQAVSTEISIKTNEVAVPVAKSSGNAISTAIGTGMEESVAVDTAMTNITIGLDTEAEKFRESGYKSGIALTDGMAAGITDGSIKVTAAADSMAKAAVDAANARLDINSPSKVFEKIGSYVDQGLINGISKDIPRVAETTSGMGTKMAESMRSALSDVTLDNMDMDVNPTITPVLDMTTARKQSDDFSKELRTRQIKMSSTAQTTDKQVQNGVRWNREYSRVNDIVDPNARYSRERTIQINNNYDVKNESDARTISNRLGTLVERSQYSRGKVAYA